MKFLSAVIFLLIPLFSTAQWQDNFDDGNIGSSPAWIGDTASFIVNLAGQLQLDADSAGSSAISTQSNPDMSNDLEWRFFIRQNFSPSSGNYGRIYLVSDRQDLLGPVYGYYLQFGESLTNDAVELFRQDGTSSVSVCRTRDGNIASAFSFGLKVTRDEIGLWTIWIDSTGGTNYRQEASGAEAMYTTSSWFGIVCEYTTGNRTNFFFDDFYTGALIHDTVPPAISRISVQSSTSLEIEFTEAIDASSAALLTNFSVDSGPGNPISATAVPGYPSKLELNFSIPFIPAFGHTLTISGVHDLEGNLIPGGTRVLFTYYPAVTVSEHDVIFTEIMFEPSSSSGLPDFEYVEIFNRSLHAISLKDWTLSDGSSVSAFPETILLPHNYLILCGASAASVLSAYASVLGLSPFPVLNNDVGDHLQLRNDQGQLIEEITFSNETYRDDEKDGGGWSLERIDTSFTCPDGLNWRASGSVLGGTPGNISSVSGIYTDLEKPVLLRAALIDSVHLNIFFSEPLAEENVTNRSLYVLSNGINSSFHPDTVLATLSPSEFTLRLPFVAGENSCSINLNTGLKDCPGNEMDYVQDVRFAMPSAVDTGDIVINEILFNPQIGGFDFVELYNRSNKVLDLKSWRVAEADFDDPANAQGSKVISEKNFLFFPGEFLVITKSYPDINMRYETPGRRPFVVTDDFPDFNSDNGTVIIYDSMGIILDQFSYSEELHFPLILEKSGVSLERLSPEIASQQNSNWHSASSSSGFATPGRKNSVGWKQIDEENDLSIEPKVFSPDNDGIDDLLFINLKRSGKQGIARIYVFDLAGRLIRDLASQSLLGDEYSILWDGLNDKGEVSPIGFYIIYAEVFDADGLVRKNKVACALTMK